MISRGITKELLISSALALGSIVGAVLMWIGRVEADSTFAVGFLVAAALYSAACVGYVFARRQVVDWEARQARKLAKRNRRKRRRSPHK